MAVVIVIIKLIYCYNFYLRYQRSLKNCCKAQEFCFKGMASYSVFVGKVNLNVTSYSIGHNNLIITIIIITTIASDDIINLYY